MSGTGTVRRRCGVVGASGYAGTELLRLCASHPQLDVVVATAQRHAGLAVTEHTPSLLGAYFGLVYGASDPATIVDQLDGLDVVFLALPHGSSQQIVPQLVGRVGLIVDLGADFRMRDEQAYVRWYGMAHEAPELLARFAYGLPELFRSELTDAGLIAAPGCYPTATALALAPLVRAGVIDRNPSLAVIVDAASGVSGAGRSAQEDLQFGEVAGGFRAYGLLNHRHTGEMEQVLEVPVLFTPHLAPMTRGILATVYARPVGDAGSERSCLSTDDVLGILSDQYREDPFVTVTKTPPSTKATAGSNCAHVTARVDPRTGWVVALGAIDNLVKGAAGQAIQCANVALGLPETCGLPLAGVFP